MEYKNSKRYYYVEPMDTNFIINYDEIIKKGGKITNSPDGLTYIFPKYYAKFRCTYRDSIFAAINYCIQNGFTMFTIRKRVYKGKRLSFGLEITLPSDNKIEIKRVCGNVLPFWINELKELMRATRKPKNVKTVDWLTRICFDLYKVYGYTGIDEYLKDEIDEMTKMFKWLVV